MKSFDKPHGLGGQIRQKCAKNDSKHRTYVNSSNPMILWLDSFQVNNFLHVLYTSIAEAEYKDFQMLKK